MNGGAGECPNARGRELVRGVLRALECARWPGPARGCCENGPSAAPVGLAGPGARGSACAAPNSSWTWVGLAIPVVSPKAISSAPAAHRRARDPQHALRRHAALVGTAGRYQDEPSQRSPAARARDSTASRPSSDSAIERLTFSLVVGLRGRQEHADLVERGAIAAMGRWRAQRRPSSRPRSLGNEHPDADLRRGRRCARAPREHRPAGGSRRPRTSS